MTCTEDLFVEDVKHHVMTVLRDDGVYRHVRFGKPGTNCMQFDLVTWPGYLSFSGDMGCYVFTRIHDMFEFFRRDCGINPSYWGEKVAAAQPDGVTEFSPDAFRAAIASYLDESEATQELRDEVEAQVLCHADDGEYAARQSAGDFEHNGFQFHDFWEINCSEFSFRFLWCCYALVWGIHRYDDDRDGVTPRGL